MELDLWIYLFLFFIGAAAGLVDSVAGGGGVLTVPVLLSIGLPVPVALGTNKLQSCCGTFTAAYHYIKGGLVSLRECRNGIVVTAVSAMAGALTVRLINADFLEAAIPWLLVAILVYTIIRPQVGYVDHPPRMSLSWFWVVFGGVLGFYDGFFGPGAGSFWTIAFVAVMGFNFSKATGYTKVVNLTSNAASLLLFAFAGAVHWRAGFAMALGQIVGARIGSHLVMTRGAKLVRPIFLVMVVLTMARLLYVRYLRG